MKYLRTFALPLLACLFLAACSSLNKLGDVVVDITEFGPAISETQANVTLRFVNGNVFPMAIGMTRSKLYLNNEYIGTATDEGPIGIPQIGTVSRKAILQIEKPEVLQKIKNGSADSVAFRLDSVMRLEVSEDKSRLKSSTTGQLSAASFRTPPAPEKKN